MAFGAPPPNGHWAFTPNRGRATFTALRFHDGTGNGPVVTLTDCTVTFDRDTASGAELLDCPFEVPAGTYSVVGLDIDYAFEVLIDDPVNGVFTETSGIVGAPPAKVGFATMDLTVAQGGPVGTQQSFLASPVTVSEESPPQLEIAADMVHTVFVNIAGGTPSFDVSTPNPAVWTFASASGLGRVQFYSPSNTAENVLMPGPTDNESQSARILYDASDAPLYVFAPSVGAAYNAVPEDFLAGSEPNGCTTGTYLGKDPDGIVCWAQSTDCPFALDTLCQIQATDTIGAAAVLECQHDVANIPPPGADGTYASGCPTMTPDQTINFSLVAQ